MYKVIGRVIEDVEGLDLGGEHEDMTGVYTTGLSELVGAANRLKRARMRQGRVVLQKGPTGKVSIVRKSAGGVSPMKTRSVTAVQARRPGIARINVDTPLVITPSSVSPMNQKIDPATRQLLRIINQGTQPMRRDGIAVYRQRSGWPGGGRNYNY
jgi:hypothetical protein